MSILPLFIVLCVYAALAKGGARLFRRTVISWPLCFLYAGLLCLVGTLIGGLMQFALAASGAQLPFMVSLVIGGLVQIACGAAFFSKFAKTADGDPLHPIAAAKLAAIVVGLFSGLSVGFWLLGALVLRQLTGHGA